MRRTSFGTLAFACVAGVIYFSTPASMQGPGRPTASGSTAARSRRAKRWSGSGTGYGRQIWRTSGPGPMAKESIR